jgi:hypothetical protein
MRNYITTTIAVTGLCLAGMSGALQAQTRQLAVSFTNLNTKYSNSDVHFMFGGGGSVQGTIDYIPSNAVVALVPQQDYTLAQVGPGGITVSNFVDGKIFVSLGASVVSTNPAYNPGHPDFQPGSADPAAQVRWDKLETTIFASTNTVQSSGINMSAADFFSIPMAVVTKRNGTNVGTITWHPATDTSVVFSNLAALAFNNVSYAAVVGTTASALTNGISTVVNGGTSNILRVISPANVAAAANPNPYVSFTPYLDYVKASNITAHITGTYGGRPIIPTNTPLPNNAFSNQVYDFVGSITPSGDMVLVGYGDLVSTQTLTIHESDLAAGVYSADPIYTLGSLPGTNLHNYNSVYDSVISDMLAGFNLGLVGTTNTDPRTGNGITTGVTVIGQESSDAWFSRGPTYGLNPKFTPEQLFRVLWPSGQIFYNTFASYLSPITDAYSFPYTDKTASPFLDLTYPNADAFAIIILPDTATPPPTGVKFLSWAPLPGAGLQLTFNVPEGVPYTLQASENLVTWTNLSSSNGLPGGIETFSDNTSTPSHSRYYRIHP